MQRWFAADPAAGEPWALYAASNLGSFAGLIAYPLVAEPLLSMREQSWGWSRGYALLDRLVAPARRARLASGGRQRAGSAQPGRECPGAASCGWPSPRFRPG